MDSDYEDVYVDGIGRVQMRRDVAPDGRMALVWSAKTRSPYYEQREFSFDGTAAEARGEIQVDLTSALLVTSISFSHDLLTAGAAAVPFSPHIRLNDVGSGYDITRGAVAMANVGPIVDGAPFNAGQYIGANRGMLEAFMLLPGTILGIEVSRIGYVGGWPAGQVDRWRVCVRGIKGREAARSSL